MPSEQRLHPVSVLFAFARSVKAFALPGLVVLITTGRSTAGPDRMFGLAANWEMWLMLLLVPSAAVAVARYLSFRLRDEGNELIIRTGIIFRNERHIPYARIQNLDAVQNVFHRLLGVAEIRVETGASHEPEATLRVLPVSAFEEMRRRVFESRGHADTAAGAQEGFEARPAAAQPLLHMPLQELLLFGFLENRGLVLVGAFYGLLWEVGLLNGLWNRLFDSGLVDESTLRALLGMLVTGQRVSAGHVLMALAGIAGLLLVVRLVSMCWAVIRLHGFCLTRAASELRLEFGLFTRVAAAIPLGRIQTMTIREGPLHRLMKRVSIRVETAGGGATEAGGATTEREWLAPLVRTTALGELVRHVLPDADLAALRWQPPHPRAFRRAVKPGLLMAVAISAVAATLLDGWAFLVLAVTLSWAAIAGRQHVKHLGWIATEDLVMFRSGWLWRSTTIARLAKVQVVTLHESPFDRRAAMARLRIDTAGAGSHRVDIPYLAKATARDLHHRLASRAAETTFRW